MAEKSNLELFKNKLEEAFRIIDVDATAEEEWAKAKDETIRFSARFVEDDEEDDEDGDEEGEEVDEDAAKEGEEGDEQASLEEVSEEDRKKHDATIAAINKLLGKQRFLLSRELCACTKSIEYHREREAYYNGNDRSKSGLTDAELVVLKNQATVKIMAYEDQIKALKERFCTFQQQIVDQDEELLDALRAGVPKDCRDATPISCESGNTLILHPDEVSFNIVPYIESWTKYFHEEYVGDDESDDDGPPPAKKVKTGAKSPFVEAMQKQIPILVEYSTGGDHQWHQAKIMKNEGKSMYTVKYLELNDEGKQEVEEHVRVKRLALNGPGEHGDDRRTKYNRGY